MILGMNTHRDARFSLDLKTNRVTFRDYTGYEVVPAIFLNLSELETATLQFSDDVHEKLMESFLENLLRFFPTFLQAE